MKLLDPNAERDPDALYLDNSTGEAVNKCELQGLLRYAWDRDSLEERAPIKAGTCAHEAIAVWFKTNDKTQALQTMADGYAAWADEHVDPDHPRLGRLAWPNLRRIMDHWFDCHLPIDLPVKIRQVEIPFACELAPATARLPRVILCGKMDAFGDDLREPGLWNVEVKTTGSVDANWLSKFRLGSQISGYTWAAQQHAAEVFGDAVDVRGVLLLAIEFSTLPSDPTRKCNGSKARGIEAHNVPYSECGHLHAKFVTTAIHRTSEQIEQWRQAMLATAYRWHRLRRLYPTVEFADLVPQTGMFNDSCRWCFAQDFCYACRPVDLIGSMFAVDHWDPLTRMHERA